jgi:hypothetical protein
MKTRFQLVITVEMEIDLRSDKLLYPGGTGSGISSSKLLKDMLNGAANLVALESGGELDVIGAACLMEQFKTL